MKNWRTLLVITLMVLPVVVFVVIGTWALWETGMLLWSWWLWPVCWGAAYLLARYWKAEFLPPTKAAPKSPGYWTPRDEEAARLITAKQQAAKDIPFDSLMDPYFYLDSGVELSLEIARHYHPKAQDPVTSLTIPEILAAIHLASEDLEEWVHRYVPGSHLLSVRQLRTLSRAPEWYNAVRDISWAVSMLVNPINIGRFITSRLTMDPLTTHLQSNALVAFYVVFLRFVGFYLIEMNSGRLRGGARRYREAMALLKQPGPADEAVAAPIIPEPSEEPKPAPVEVTVCIVGQVKAGKSSLINALLGEQQAATDVLPLTKDVQRYRLSLDDPPEQLVLLDTSGYGDDGATEDQIRQMQTAFRTSDLVLLVMNVQNPARDADLKLLRRMSDWFKEQPHLKPVPILGVLTHIDGLRPVMEWDPPYNWKEPSRPKERTIRDAVDHVQQEFGPLLEAVAPVCTDAPRERVYGVEEWLIPAMTALLSDARACSLLRTLHAEFDRARLRVLLKQVRNIGTELMTSLIRR